MELIDCHSYRGLMRRMGYHSVAPYQDWRRNDELPPQVYFHLRAMVDAHLWSVRICAPWKIYRVDGPALRLVSTEDGITPAARKIYRLILEGIPESDIYVGCAGDVRTPQEWRLTPAQTGLVAL